MHPSTLSTSHFKAAAFINYGTPGSSRRKPTSPPPSICSSSRLSPLRFSRKRLCPLFLSTTVLCYVMNEFIYFSFWAFARLLPYMALIRHRDVIKSTTFHSISDTNYGMLYEEIVFMNENTNAEKRRKSLFLMVFVFCFDVHTMALFFAFKGITSSKISELKFQKRENAIKSPLSRNFLPASPKNLLDELLFRNIWSPHPRY